MRWMICFLFGLLFTGTAAAQSKDAESLEGIRNEIRQLRQDLRTLVGTTQRAQILIARVQVADAAIKRVQDRIEEGHATLGRMQDEQRQMGFELKRNEESLSQIDNTKARKEIEDAIAMLKAALEQRSAAQQEMQAKVIEAEEQLRVEQAKLGRLQDELDRVDKAIQEPSQGPR